MSIYDSSAINVKKHIYYIKNYDRDFIYDIFVTNYGLNFIKKL